MRILTLTAAALALTAGVASASTFDGVDRNDDGMISKSEFTKIYGPDLDVASFRIVDANDDGLIDAEEFASERFGVNGILSDDS